MLKGFISVVSANHRKAIVHLQHRNWQYRNLLFMMEWWDGKKQAHYTGKLESGQVFDSSYNRGKPLTFRIGVGEVLQSLSLCFLFLLDKSIVRLLRICLTESLIASLLQIYLTESLIASLLRICLTESLIASLLRICLLLQSCCAFV